MDKAVGVIAFVVGTAIGSVTTWYFTKKYYGDLAQEEIDSVKEVFSNRHTTDEDAEVKVVEDIQQEDDEFEFNEEDATAYNDLVEDLGYSEEAKSDKPYVIPPYEFGEILEYNHIELTYYSDGVLVEENEPVEDVDNIVGADFALHFGEYEDDSVYVRNDCLKSDYAILYDQREYSEALKTIPHQTEV